MQNESIVGLSLNLLVFLFFFFPPASEFHGIPSLIVVLSSETAPVQELYPFFLLATLLTFIVTRERRDEIQRFVFPHLEQSGFY